MPSLEVLPECARRRAASSDVDKQLRLRRTKKTTGTVICHARESRHPERPRQSLDSRVRGNDTLIEFEALENSDLIAG